MDTTPYAAQAQQVNKFLEQTLKLGAQMDRMQGTTRIIYDTSGPLNGTQSSVNFFENVGSKSFPQTNISENRFQPGEGMVIKEIGIRQIGPLGGFNWNTALLNIAVLDVYIGNNRVIKALPLTAFNPLYALNPLNNEYAISGATTNKLVALRMINNLVIPPQVNFRAELRFAGPFGTPQSVGNLKMYFKGYGKLFNPNNNF